MYSHSATHQLHLQHCFFLHSDLVCCHSIHAAYSQVSETKVKEFSLFTEPLLISIKEWFIFYLSFNDRHFDRCPSKSASKLRKTSTHLKLGAVSILRSESFRKLSRLTK